MKNVITSLLFSVILNFAKGQASNLEGLWTECTGVDSLKVIQCDKGYSTYYLDKKGLYVSGDSMICNSKKRAVTGRWEISENQLTIFHDTNECLSYYPSNKYKIAWINNDLFYSGSIGTVDWKGQKIFTVFKRIK